MLNLFLYRIVNCISDRALELTAICLRLNPANYTTWWFRRQILASQSLPTQDSKSSKSTYFSEELIRKDLKLVSKLGGSNPKNYQIWYHRRNLLEKSFSDIATGLTMDETLSSLLDDELDYISSVFDEDAKNYHVSLSQNSVPLEFDNYRISNFYILHAIICNAHECFLNCFYQAWSHRQWILKTVNMTEKWEEEMDFVDKLLKDDIRNNSAWNQRWFVVHRGSKSTPIRLEVAREEIKFSISKACLDPYNESAWRYFVAFVKEQLQAIGKTSEFTEFLESCQDAITDTKKIFEEESKKDGMECIHMIAAYIDILEMKGDAKSLSNAQKLAEELGDRYDTVRRTYWMLRSKQLKSN